jgi:hypothetical protein
MFSTISALEIARQHSEVSHDSNNSKSPDITKFGHFGVPKTTLIYLVVSRFSKSAFSTFHAFSFQMAYTVAIVC